MRYVGQEHAVTVDLPMAICSRQRDIAGIKRCFDETHELRYGTSVPTSRRRSSACAAP